MPSSKLTTSFPADTQRLPEGFRRLAYDADRQVYLYADASGQRWEGRPGATYGTLRSVPDEPVFFSSARHRDSVASSSSAGASPTFSTADRSEGDTARSASFSSAGSAMTRFPDTWDPPADQETRDLPTAKRVRAQFSTLRKSVMRKGGRKRAESVVGEEKEDGKEGRARAKTVGRDLGSKMDWD